METAWSAVSPAVKPARTTGLGGVPYAELHSHSRFSFMDGSSSPEGLVAEAVRLGLDALALTDRDGFLRGGALRRGR